MTGFFFHHFCLNRSRNMGRRLRAIRVRLARNRRVVRRMRQSLSSLRISAEQIHRRNERMIAENALIDQLVYDLLAEIENDPFIRNAFEGIHAQNLDERNQAQPPRGGGGADDRRE